MALSARARVARIIYHYCSPMMINVNIRSTQNLNLSAKVSKSQDEMVVSPYSPKSD